MQRAGEPQRLERRLLVVVRAVELEVPATRCPGQRAGHGEGAPVARRHVPEGDLRDACEVDLALGRGAAEGVVGVDHQHARERLRLDAVRQATRRRVGRELDRPDGRVGIGQPDRVHGDHAVQPPAALCLVEVEQRPGDGRQVRVEVGVGEERGGVELAVAFQEAVGQRLGRDGGRLDVAPDLVQHLVAFGAGQLDVAPADPDRREEADQPTGPPPLGDVLHGEEVLAGFVESQERGQHRRELAAVPGQTEEPAPLLECLEAAVGDLGHHVLARRRGELVQCLGERVEVQRRDPGRRLADRTEVEVALGVADAGRPVLARQDRELVGERAGDVRGRAGRVQRHRGGLERVGQRRQRPDGPPDHTLGPVLRRREGAGRRRRDVHGRQRGRRPRRPPGRPAARSVPPVPSCGPRPAAGRRRRRAARARRPAPR